VPWIDDVVTHTTIRSVWGNSVRDRVVHQFATTAERDGPTVHPVDGMCCHTAADHRLWRYRGDLARWTIVDEPWQPWTPQGFIGTNGPHVVQSTLGESKMVGDQVTVRWLVKLVAGTSSAGTIYFTLPPTRGNAGPQQLPVGAGTATDYNTAVTSGVIFFAEFGQVFARKMTDQTPISTPGVPTRDISFTGTFTYRSDSYGP